MRASWREAGATDNAYVSHDKVTLGEIFDACDATGEHAALGGFFALPAAFRASVPSALMPLLVSSQLAQGFGSKAERGEQHLQDWATEPHT
mgnify:CR=1 FL=1